MHSNQAKLEAKARQYIAVCRRGFANEFAHKAWMKARILEMQAWPATLRTSVVAAWLNSGPKEASKASARSAPK